MQTTIADYVLSNPSNTAETRENFESTLEYDEIIYDAEPTLIYVRSSNIVGWYEIETNIGYK